MYSVASVLIDSTISFGELTTGPRIWNCNLKCGVGWLIANKKLLLLPCRTICPGIAWLKVFLMSQIVWIICNAKYIYIHITRFWVECRVFLLAWNMKTLSRSQDTESGFIQQRIIVHQLVFIGILHWWGRGGVQTQTLIVRPALLFSYYRRVQWCSSRCKRFSSISY